MTFSHEALLYDGPRDLAPRVMPFIEEGLDAGEPTMVALRVGAIEELCDRLGPRANDVWFVDMAQLGRNPGRIIPAWHDFVDEHGGGGRPVRGIGEPVWAGREGEELTECQLHEALLNVAFADADAFRLLCPYDTGSLPDTVIREACAGHPRIAGNGESGLYRGDADLLGPFAAPLPTPDAPLEVLAYDRNSLSELRAMVPPARRVPASRRAMPRISSSPSTSSPRTACVTAAGTACCASGPTRPRSCARSATAAGSQIRSWDAAGRQPSRRAGGAFTWPTSCATSCSCARTRTVRSCASTCSSELQSGSGRRAAHTGAHRPSRAGGHRVDTPAMDPVELIRTGTAEQLGALLRERPELAAARPDGARTLLHAVTDWPGHFPESGAKVAVLVAAGADPNARFAGGAHSETPLHWAASSDDVEALDALLDAGADLEADGAVVARRHAARRRRRLRAVGRRGRGCWSAARG